MNNSERDENLALMNELLGPGVTKRHPIACRGVTLPTEVLVSTLKRVTRHEEGLYAILAEQNAATEQQVGSDTMAASEGRAARSHVDAAALLQDLKMLGVTIDLVGNILVLKPSARLGSH